MFQITMKKYRHGNESINIWKFRYFTTIGGYAANGGRTTTRLEQQAEHQQIITGQHQIRAETQQMITGLKEQMRAEQQQMQTGQERLLDEQQKDREMVLNGLDQQERNQQTLMAEVNEKRQNITVSLNSKVDTIKIEMEQKLEEIGTQFKAGDQRFIKLGKEIMDLKTNGTAQTVRQINTIKLKPPTFDGTTPFRIFKHQFEMAVTRNG